MKHCYERFLHFIGQRTRRFCMMQRSKNLLFDLWWNSFYLFLKFSAFIISKQFFFMSITSFLNTFFYFLIITFDDKISICWNECLFFMIDLFIRNMSWKMRWSSRFSIDKISDATLFFWRNILDTLRFLFFKIMDNLINSWSSGYRRIKLIRCIFFNWNISKSSGFFILSIIYTISTYREWHNNRLQNKYISNNTDKGLEKQIFLCLFCSFCIIFFLRKQRCNDKSTNAEKRRKKKINQIII